MWGSVREDEKGSAGPVDAFKSGVRAGSKKLPIGEGFLRVELLGKGNEVVNLVGFLDGNKGRAATAIVRKRRVELRPRSRGVGVGLPAPQTDRHRMGGRRRSRTPSLKGVTCRRSSLTTARRVAGGGRRLVRGLPCRC